MKKQLQLLASKFAEVLKSLPSGAGYATRR